MSFFSHISDVLHKIVSSVAHLFTQENVDKAFELVAPASDLLAFAAPWVERIASATPTSVDDKLVSLAESVNTDIQSLLAEPDPAVRKGKLLTLVGQGALADIKALFVQGGTGINIGPYHIATANDVHIIPGDLFDLAAQVAYSLFVKNRG